MSKDDIGDNGLCNVYTKSIAGFGSMLKQLFPEKQLPVVDGALNAGKRYLDQQGRKIAYPYFTLTVSGSDLNRDGYNIKALLRQGRVMVDSQDHRTANAYHLVPTLVDLRVQFITNKYTEVLTFDQRWKIAAIKNLFQMLIEPVGIKKDDDTGRSAIHIRTTLAEAVQVPEPMSEGDEKDKEYVVETTAQMRTYLGIIESHTRVLGHIINLRVYQGVESGAKRLSDHVEVNTQEVWAES